MSTQEKDHIHDLPGNNQPLVVQRAGIPDKIDTDRNGAAFPQPIAAETAADATAYLHALRRHWLLGLSLGVIVAAAFGAATFLLLPRYFTPYSLIRVAVNQESIVWDKGNVARQDYEVFKNTQLGLIKSPYVLTSALRKKNISELSIVKRESDPFAWLEDELRASYINDSEIMRVSLTDTDAEEATDLVNAVVDAYIEEIVNKDEKERRDTLAQLTQIYNAKEAEIRRKRANFIELADQLNASHSDAVKVQSEVNIRELYDLRAALIRMQMSLGEAQGELQISQTMLERVDEMPVSEIELEQLVRADPVCKEQSQMVAGLRSAVAQQNQMALPGVNRNSVDRLARQLETIEREYSVRENELRDLLKAAKRTEIEEKIAEAEAKVQILTAQVEEMQAQVVSQKDVVKEIGKSSVDIEMMMSDLTTLEQTLAEISAQREKLNVESQARPRISVAQEAQEPRTVDKPKLALILAIMASGVGFILPFGGIVWWDIRNNRVNSAEDVARKLGLPVIGSVPTIPGRAIRRLGSESGRDLYWNVRLTESIDAIAAKLLRNQAIEGKRVVLVTSAVSGECKTTLATQIAMSMARNGRRTVLVDFDLRKPAIHKAFQLPLDPGVSECLCGEVNSGDAVVETGIDNLFVLTSGRSDHHALQALANGKDRLLFEELREQYEFVIIDGSPILPVADSRYLSQHVDTVVLSVFRDYSRMPKVVSACEILESFGVTDLEAVVTSSTESGHAMDMPGNLQEA